MSLSILCFSHLAVVDVCNIITIFMVAHQYLRLNTSRWVESSTQQPPYLVWQSFAHRGEDFDCRDEGFDRCGEDFDRCVQDFGRHMEDDFTSRILLFVTKFYPS